MRTTRLVTVHARTRESWIAFMLWIISHRTLVAFSIAGLLVLQRTVEAYASGSFKVAMGDVLSLALCASIVVLGAPILGRRRSTEKESNLHIKPAYAYTLLTVLLAVNAFSGHTAKFLALLRKPPPTIPLIIVIGFWITVLSWVVRKGYSTRSLVVSLVGLVTGTRLLVLEIWPFHRIDGDMLTTIDRALGELTSGRFPYINYPPPMPYPPGTFLAYLPPKVLGLDLRYTNLAVDALTILATIFLARLHATRNQSDNLASVDTAPMMNQLLLPCFMLHPIWIHYSVNSHFSPCLLFSMLLGFAVLFENVTIQALALGFAVGSNQMLAACGPILFAYWAGRVGLRRATALTVLSVAIFLLIIAPFLLWDPRRFLEIAFLSRNRFSDSLMAGRFTLFPLASRLIPRACLIGSTTALTVASWAAYRSRSSGGAVTAMAWGLCAALLFQPVSFTHYYLPAIVLVSVIPTFHPIDRTHRFSPNPALSRSRRARAWVKAD
jgi:hypothetical protein